MISLLPSPGDYSATFISDAARLQRGLSRLLGLLGDLGRATFLEP